MCSRFFHLMRKWAPVMKYNIRIAIVICVKIITKIFENILWTRPECDVNSNFRCGAYQLNAYVDRIGKLNYIGMNKISFISFPVFIVGVINM